MNNLLFPFLLQENDSRGIEDHHGSFGCENIDDIMSDPKVVVLGRDIKHVLNYIAHVMRSRVQESSERTSPNQHKLPRIQKARTIKYSFQTNNKVIPHQKQNTITTWNNFRKQNLVSIDLTVGDFMFEPNC